MPYSLATPLNDAIPSFLKTSLYVSIASSILTAYGTPLGSTFGILRRVIISIYRQTSSHSSYESIDTIFKAIEGILIELWIILTRGGYFDWAVEGGGRLSRELE